MNLIGLEFLAFGNVSVAVLALLVIAVVLAGVIQVGILFLKLALATDDESVPDYDFKNIVWSKLSNLFLGGEIITQVRLHPEVGKLHGGYAVKVSGSSIPSYYSVDGNRTWRADTCVRDYCIFTDAVEANKLAEEKYGKLTTEAKVSTTHYEGGVNLKTLLLIPLLDVCLLSLQYHFFLTIIICSIVGLVFTTRTISKMVHKNSNKLKGHGERIEDLESKVKDND